MEKNKKTSILFSGLLILILGLVVGMIIYLFFISSSLGTLSDLSQDLDLDAPKYNNTSLVIQDPRRVYISQDLKIDETLNYLDQSVLAVFLRNEENSYSLDQGLLSGLVISSDGWVLLNVLGLEDFDLNLIKKPENYILASKKEKKIQDIEEILDFSSDGFLLAKIKKSNNLLVRNFVNISDLSLGQTVFSYNFLGEIMLNSIRSFNSGPDLKFSDQYQSQIKLGQKLDDSFAGAYLFDLSGDLIALVGQDLELKSVHSFRPLIYSFFKNKELEQPSFGLWYLDLKNIIDPNLPLKGNLVSRILPGSIAEKSGLIVGDIITKLNNYEINDKANFNDILNNFIRGDKLSLIVLRDGQLIELKLNLK